MKFNSVLDIGTGRSEMYKGRLRKVSPNMKYETLDNYHEADHDIDITKGFIQDKTFDLLLLLNVIEHIGFDHDKMFPNILNMMRKESKLIVSVPFLMPYHSDHDYIRLTRKGVEQMLSRYFDNILIYPYGNKVLAALSIMSRMKVISVFFNKTSFLWEKLFPKNDDCNCNGFFAIATERKLYQGG